MLGGILLSLLAVARISAATQKPFFQQQYGSVSSGISVHGNTDFVHDLGLFTPLEDLSYLSSSEFTTLSHPAFPNHRVRIKKSDFCDGTVGTYTGYIDIQARHLFFYFFESRNNPDKDDVIFWTNGGPGCSSSVGLFMELGPCRVTNPNNSTFNPYSWNEQANIFFIDQPIGVGFSYADYGETVVRSDKSYAVSDMSLRAQHVTEYNPRGSQGCRGLHCNILRAFQQI